MTFIRRLKLFGFGFVLGLIMVYFIFGHRRCTGNSVLKIQELNFQTYKYSDSFRFSMRQLNMDSTWFIKHLNWFQVDFKHSQVHAKPFGIYRLIPDSSGSKNFTITITDQDSITYFKSLIYTP
jgi:hypothetical protein